MYSGLALFKIALHGCIGLDENPEFIEKKVDDILILPIVSSTFKSQMAAWMRYISFRKLKVINITTLIVHDKQDILVLRSNGKLLTEKIPMAEIVSFDSNAHFIHTEEPDKFIEVLLRFLK